MFQGKVHVAMRFLTEKGQGSLLNITDDVLDQLKTKHPSPAVILKESLLYGPINQVPEIYFSIDENTVLRAAVNTRGSARGHALTLISSDVFYYQTTFPKKGNVSERKYHYLPKKSQRHH
jgi:hypothetical protein